MEGGSAVIRDAFNSDEHGEALHVIAEANGWTRDEVIQNRLEFRYLELFLLQFIPSVPQIRFFPNLTCLKLIHCGLTEIRHLDSLVQLEQLWLCENDIERIEGLSTLVSLRELYLNNNNIAVMENLIGMPQLSVLWLSRNRISAIAGLEDVPQLRSLWIAGNRISSLDKVFPSTLTKLQDLNLAGNRILSFRDIPTLNELKVLSWLCFADPMYGDNPICQLSNYQTFTLYHLPSVMTLDFVSISTEQRQLAESTFVKKKIYYSMRTNTIQRNLAMLIENCQMTTSRKLGESWTSMGVLQRMLRQVQQNVSELQTYGTLSSTTDLDAAARESLTLPLLTATTEKIVAAMESRRREMQAAEKKRLEATSAMRELCAGHIARLMLELNTGGNVRLEEGKPRDVWQQSCAELLRTRFFRADFDALDIRDVQVLKVTRVHNRGLRGRFDATLGQLVDLSDPSYKRALEYLFYALPLESDLNINDAVEHGFAYQGMPTGPVPMTNSVYLADQCRLENAQERGILQTTSPNFNADVLVGRLVVAKVFLGKCIQDKNPAPPQLARNGTVIRAADYRGASSVYRMKASDPKQRVWFCLDSDLVLPEYIVEYSYVRTGGPTPAMAEFASDEAQQQLTKLFPRSTATDINDLRVMGAHCYSLRKWCASAPQSAIAAKDAAELLASPPLEVPRPRVDGEISEARVQQYAKTVGAGEGGDKGPLTYFAVPSAGVTSLGLPSITSGQTFSSLASLKQLVLFDNQLTSVPWFELAKASPLLESLDVGYNQIKRMHNIAGANFPRLRTLNMENNLLFFVDDFLYLGQAAPQVTNLDFSQNPVMNEKRVEMFCAVHLPTLQILNGLKLSDNAEIVQRLDRPKELSLPLLSVLIEHVNKATNGALCGGDSGGGSQSGGLLMERTVVWRLFDEALASTSQLRATTTKDAPVSAEALRLLSNAQSVALNHAQLTSLAHMDRLTKLVYLQLQGQFLLDATPLGVCAHLEVLDLCDNRLRSTSGLENLLKLRRLELSHNAIENIEAVESLRSLQYFNVGHNKLRHLHVLSQCLSLIECYASSNLIESEKEVIHLRDLPKLIILDLALNPCTQVPLYRSYCVFQMKRLKVLDGTSIDSQETLAARDTFAGRVSAELLKERLHGSVVDWALARELNLASCALKEITLLEAFTSLTHLKLEHNLLVNIDGLKSCSNLIALNLAHNKLSHCPVGQVFEAMPNLESLSLEANGITSVSSLLLNCPRLKFLNLKANELTKLDGLDRVPQLREVLLDKNKLRSIDRDCLVFVPHLRELYCEENAIKTIEGIQAAVNLQKVSFASNRISEVADVCKYVEGLPITDICFLGNPVVRKAFHRNHLIHSLPQAVVIDNRVVTVEERERVEGSFQQDTIPPNVFTDVRMPMQGGPIVVPVPPTQRVQMRVVSLDADTASAPPAQLGNRGRPNGPAVRQPQVLTPQRTSSADLRPSQNGGGGVGPTSSGNGMAGPYRMMQPTGAGGVPQSVQRGSITGSGPVTALRKK